MYTDQELLQSLQIKDIEAYKFIYSKYGPALFGLLMKELADAKLSEQLLYASFTSIWHNFNQYDSNNGRLFTWMYQIVQKEIKNVQHNKPIVKTKKKNPLALLQSLNFKFQFQSV